MFWINVVEKMKKHILCSVTFFENCTAYKIISKIMVETEGPQMSQYGTYALRAGLVRLYELMRMHTPKRPITYMQARTRKHAHTDQYVILIAFPQQQLFRKCSSVLHYTYIACLVMTYYESQLLGKTFFDVLHI
jgi:hypothetical protein